MFDVDRLKAVEKIFVHASCPDGLASAMLCATGYGVHRLYPKIEFLQYGTAHMADMEPGPNQMFVDITPPVPRWEEWKEHSPIVLDHHATARIATEGLGGVYGTSVQSGASLAHEHVFKPLMEESGLPGASYMRLEELAELAAVRDTWQDSHEKWTEASGMAHALMDGNPKEILEAARNGTTDFDDLFRRARREGQRIDFKSRKLAESAHFERVMCRGISYLVGCFNCTEKLTSDAANMLLRHGCDVAVGWFEMVEDGTPRWVVSLRTNGEVSARVMAETRGGGGHERAAGFRIGDGLNVSVRILAQTVATSMWEAAKKGGIAQDDGRERKTKEQVLESLMAGRAASRV